MRIGSVFSGIGGLELGLERAGLGHVVWQIEIDPFCRAVLAKHWPDVTRYEDVRTATALPGIDLLCGGFPCQPVSCAGKRKAHADARWLWPAFRRIIAETQPRWVVIENVLGLRTAGLRGVLCDLAALGFDAEWSDISACSMGLPHSRRRLFVVAYPHRFDGEAGVRGPVARAFWALQAPCAPPVPRAGASAWMEDPSALYRGANGVPARVDRLRALGNAVVPQVAEAIGRAINRVEVWDCERGNRAPNADLVTIYRGIAAASKEKTC